MLKIFFNCSPFVRQPYFGLRVSSFVACILICDRVFYPLLPPPDEVWEGNVFTGVCLFTGGGYVSSDDHQVSLAGVEVGMSRERGYVQVVGIPWDLGYPPSTVLEPSGGQQNTYGWQASGTHRTGMLSCCFIVVTFTLPDTKTETDTDTNKMCTEPNGNLHRYLSLSGVCFSI